MSVLVRPPLNGAAGRRPGYLKVAGLRALAAFLALWAPFFIFTAYRGYPLPTSALLYSAAVCGAVAALFALACGRRGYKRQAIVLALLVAIALDMQFGWFRGVAAYAVGLALIGLFWILRHHVAAILATVFGALIVSTAVVGPLDPYLGVQVVEYERAGTGAAGKAPGRVIHLLLDEYAGIAGIPTEVEGGASLREEQRAFFARNGFRLFGNAISEYEASRNSISGILNFTAGPTPYERYDGRRPFVLKRSRYFEALGRAGYDIRVYQSAYMDYCRVPDVPITRCYTYRHDGTDWLKSSSLPDVDKLQLFFSLYLNRSNIVEAVLKGYVRLSQVLAAQGVQLPALPEWDDSPSSVNAMAAFEHVIEEAASGPEGTVYFAHLLIPHGPYAFDRECRMRRSFASWLSNRPPYRRSSSESERAQRYRAYFEQLGCMQVKLQQLFDRLQAAGRFEAATIIIHGDHGSRIHVVPARAGQVDRLRQRDYLDGFATLFAARSAALEPGFDNETAPVSRLLARAIGREDLIPDPHAPLQVFLEDKDYEPWPPVFWRFSE